MTAKNSRGSGDAFSTPTDVVPDTGSGGIIDLPGGGKSIDAKDVAKEQRLVVDSVLFDPNPVRSRTTPLYVSIRVTETGKGYAVRNATVFIRSTPLLDEQRGQRPHSASTAGSRTSSSPRATFH